MSNKIVVRSISDIHRHARNNRQYINIAAAIANLNLNMGSFAIHNEEYSPSMKRALEGIGKDTVDELRHWCPEEFEYSTVFGKEGIFGLNGYGMTFFTKHPVKLVNNSRSGVKPLPFSESYNPAELVKASTMVGPSGIGRRYEYRISLAERTNFIKKSIRIDMVPHYRRGLKKLSK